MSRLVEYCNLTTDLQNAYKEIEQFAYEKIDNDLFSVVSGQTYSELGQVGYVGALYINRIKKTAATNAASIAIATPYYYDSTNDILYVLTASIGTNEISLASADWETLAGSAREDASQELEGYLRHMIDTPFPFAKNSTKTYDRDIVRACAYLTCARIVEMDNPENKLAERLRLMVWDDIDETGIINKYVNGKKNFSFQATTQSYNGNVIPKSQAGSGYIELAGYSDDWDSYLYEIEITKAGAVGTAEYKITKDNVVISTSNITYTNYRHLHANTYVKFIGTFTVGDKWQIEFDGRVKRKKEAGLGSMRIVHKSFDETDNQDTPC